MRHLAVLVLAASPLACLRSTSFQCASNDQCGGDGVCEAATGFCSFVDANCPMGRRYGDLSGPFAGKCVGEPIGTDGGMEGTPGDGPQPDTPPGADCKSSGGYMAIPSGQTGHTYRTLTTLLTWTQQRDKCVLDSATLVIPDDATELGAVAAFAASAFWVGISDQATENSFVTVLGPPATFLPWKSGQPDDKNPGEDCVRADNATLTFSDEKCGNTARAVCECVP